MAQVEVVGEAVARIEEVLPADALAFVAELEERFGPRRRELLARRAERHAELAAGRTLDFLAETAHVREADWTVAPAPADLLDRRVEITGPTDRKMAINALNSGARVWLADLEDANTPHWRNVVDGQLTLRDAARRTISFISPTGAEYRLAEGLRLATIVVRPRGWHMEEEHIRVDGAAASASLVDFGLHFHGNAAELLARGSGPYFYLPKMESHLEARLWAEVFAFSEERLGIARGSVRATALIETIPAAFEMHEILYELREYSSGLNAGRWDYLFSIVKQFRDAGEEFVLPDRNAVGMTAPFMAAYARLLVQTCHRRGAHAIGGMSAFIPSRRDEAVNRRAFAKVREDKAREASLGFDGSWVAHPDLVPLCETIFDTVLGTRPNQVGATQPGPAVTAAELLDVGSIDAAITEKGLRGNVRVSVLYLESWLRGGGAVAIDNLMEDAATAEISRSQIWQWVRHGAALTDGRTVTAELVRALSSEEGERIRREVGDDAYSSGRYAEAAELFESVALAPDYIDFLTIPAYRAVLESATGG